ncbi:MAG TPA: hypothetical protein VFL34_06310 [Candidatus Sulfotelmatobacter sp.]|nr:hypothetical protein [Candidatus Sulfotelmatobacter sp.]
MTLRKFSRFFPFSALALISATICPAIHAQAPLAPADPDAPTTFVEPSTSSFVPASALGEQHRFWDKRNTALFVAAAALNGADFAVTRANLQSGGQELNPVVRMFGRSSAGLAVNFIGETAGIVSISYFFHKTGHHKLERMVSMANIGTSAGAVTYDLTHR